MNIQKPFRRYARILELMQEALATKTGWGRVELLAQLQTVLLQVADEELNWIEQFDRKP